MDQSHDHPRSNRHLHDLHHDIDGSANYDNMATDTKPESFFLDNIIVGYAFGHKKMETMGLIMAEASKALSTFECDGNLSSMINKRRRPQQQNSDAMDCFEESSVTTMTTGAASMLTSQAAGENSGDVEKESSAQAQYFSDNDEDTRSLSSTYTRSSFVSQRSQQRGLGGSNGVNGIQLTFVHDSSGSFHLVRTPSSRGGAGEGESITGSSITTSATNPVSIRKHWASSASCSSMPLSSSSSFSKEMNESPQAGVGYAGKHKCCRPLSRRSDNDSGGCRSIVQRHPIRVSFVPIDLDLPLEEQHGGKFDVILHKMTEDILCMSKVLRARGLSGGNLKGSWDDMLVDEDGQVPSEASSISPPIGDPELSEATASMTRHQARASGRIQRLREYKQMVHPSCVLVDSPRNILAVMSRADMAEVLSRCLAGVTTKGGIPVRTPRFRVVDENTNLEVENVHQSIRNSRQPTLADEIESSGFKYPLIAKPLTAAGTKSSHHMGIVLARDGLQRLKTPCLLQEYANHGEKLFKVYVLGDSVWVFSRESLPNLPPGEKQIDDDDAPCKMQGKPCREGDRPLWSPHKRQRAESYVEFERPAGSRCYVEFNSQRPYPKLSDFGIISEADVSSSNGMQHQGVFEQSLAPSKKQRLDDGQSLEYCKDEGHPSQTPPAWFNHDSNFHGNSDLARFVTKDEIGPVTTALRGAFGLDLFGFDVLVIQNQNSLSDRDDGKEILVVDVNYFPGYKEVPNFPSLLAQYLTQKAVESRLRNFDGS